MTVIPGYTYEKEKRYYFSIWENALFAHFYHNMDLQFLICLLGTTLKCSIWQIFTEHPPYARNFLRGLIYVTGKSLCEAYISAGKGEN